MVIICSCGGDASDGGREVATKLTAAQPCKDDLDGAVGDDVLDVESKHGAADGAMVMIMNHVITISRSQWHWSYRR